MDRRLDHQEHESDLHDGAESRIPGGPVGIIHAPVAHADQRHGAVNEQHAPGVYECLPLHAHDGQQRSVQGDDGQSRQGDRRAAQVHQPPGAGKGLLVVPRADLLAHQDAGGVGKAHEEADDQALEGPQHRRGRDGGFGLMPQHHADHHVADADQDLIEQYGKALSEVFPEGRQAPAEMAPELQQVGHPPGPGQARDHQDIDEVGDHRAQRRAAHPHGRKAQAAEDEDKIAEEVRHHRSDAPRQRDAHLLHGAQQRSHGRGDHLQGEREADDAEILRSDGPDLHAVRIERHHQLRRKDREGAEQQARDHHEGERHAVGAPDPVVIPGAPVLGEKQHPAAHEAPVAGEHEVGELGTQAHGAHGVGPKGGDHDGIHHASCGGQQILKGHGHGDRRDHRDQPPERRAAGGIAHEDHSPTFFTIIHETVRK